MGVMAASAEGRRSRAPTLGVDAVSHAFDEAQFRKDQTALDRFLAPDMTYISGSGRIADRKAFLAAFNDPAEKFEPFKIVDRQLVVLSADVVAVTADATIRGTNSSGPFEEHFRFTDIFRLRNGVWQVVFVQVSRKPVA
jgi:ketosteroid isomerase-like protein